MAGYQERREARYEKLGTAVGGLLKDRYDQKQAEDFTQNELQLFQQHTDEFMNNLGTIEDGDQMAQAFQQWKSRTFMPFLTSATAKYANNERIMSIVQRVDEANRNGLQRWAQNEETGEQITGRDERRERETRKEEADIGFTEQKTETSKITGELAQARIGALERQEEEKATQYDIIPRDQMGAVTHQQAMGHLATARVQRPQWDAARNNEADAEGVQKLGAELRGMPKPMGGVVGDGGEGELEYLTGLYLANPERRENARNRKKLQAAGIDVDARWPGLYPEGMSTTPEERHPPLNPSAPTSSMIGNVLHTTPDQLAGLDIDPSSSRKFMETLHELPINNVGDFKKLGPFVNSILTESVIEDADGQIVSTAGGRRTPVRSFEDLKAALNLSWAERNDPLMMPTARVLRRENQKMGEAIINRYARMIADSIDPGQQTIKPPKPTKKELTFLEKTGGFFGFGKDVEQ